MTLRIGIDTGGTFTDLVASDGRGRLSFHKVASTPADPARAIVRGAAEIITAAAAATDDVELIVHGTTVATNTVLQRAGAKVAMITTAGFRDVLHIQRQDRPRMYDLRTTRTPALVPRALRFELNERMRYDASVQTPIDRDQLQALIEQFRDERVDAVAVCLLHSYANADHELAVAAAVSKALPDVTVCMSHDLVGEHGEYERFSTCVMNAYVQPVIQRYLDRLECNLTSAKLHAPLFVMKSNGGVMGARAAGRQCVETILSGPAGGVVAGAAIANVHENNNLITADMGGTSFDVSVIHEGSVDFARDAEMGGLALGVPMLDIHTVGAGGGSIGWIDAGRSLRVGPHSAGASPGPACYARGGSDPTVTDANLVLGRLGTTSLLGGGMQVDLEPARRAIHDKLARPLGLSVEQAAEGVIRVVNTTMTQAIRKLTVERGHDPRQFALCPFGGAGPLHGAELAGEMGIAQTIIPLAPGVNSAIGLLMSNLREDRVRTHITRLDRAAADDIEAIFADLQADAEQRLRSAAATDNALHVVRALGQRYLGQRYDLPVTIAEGPLDLQQAADGFHAEHERMYGFRREDQPIELASVWLSVQVDLQTIALPHVEPKKGAPKPGAQRPVYFAGTWCDTPVYHRDDLTAADEFTGPAVIEQLDSTALLWPGQHMRVDPYRQLILGPLAAAN